MNHSSCLAMLTMAVGAVLNGACPAAASLLRLSASRPNLPIHGAHVPGPLVWQEGGDLFLWDGSVRRQLTDESNHARNPGNPIDFQWRANGRGQVVWLGWNGTAYQVYLWTGRETLDLSGGHSENEDARINEAGQVVWTSDGQVLFWDGSEVQELTPTGVECEEPQINAAGQVVWTSGGEVFLWDGDIVRTITPAPDGAYDATLNDNGQVAWIASRKRPDTYYETTVRFWDGVTIRSLTTTLAGVEEPQITNKGQVVWYAVDTLPYRRVYLWDGSSVRRLSGRFVWLEDGPQINRRGQIVWAGEAIYLWDGAAVRQLAPQTADITAPRINSTGQVAWRGKEGSANEIYLWDGVTTRRLTEQVGKQPGARFGLSVGFPGPGLFDSGQVVMAASVGLATETLIYTPPAPGSLDLDPMPAWEDSTVSLTLTLPHPAPPDGTAVTFASSDPAAAPPPDPVIIPAGQSTVTFPLTLRSTDATTDVELRATADGAPYTASLTVWHRELATFEIDAERLVAGQVSLARASLELPDPAGGETIRGWSDHPEAAFLDMPLLTTLTGSTSVADSTVRTNAVARPTPVRFYATFGGRTRSALLTVVPVKVAEVSVSTTLVAPGSTIVGTVWLSGPAPAGGVTLRLEATPLDAITAPSSVTILEGAISADFMIRIFHPAVETRASVGVPQGNLSTGVSFRVARDPQVNLFVGFPSAGLPTYASLELKQPAPPGGLRLTLESEDPTAVSAPASIFVDPGNSYATFQLQVHPVADTREVRITASYQGQRWVGYAIVSPQRDGAVHLGRPSVIGGQSLLGSVSLAYPAPAGGVFVPLSSSDPSVLSVTEGVTVPEGATRATFRAKSHPTSTSTSVWVTPVHSFFGAPDGYRTLAARLDVLPPALTGLMVVPTQPAVGEEVRATLTLSAPAPSGGAVVPLVASDPTRVVLPTAVTVPEGAMSLAFPLIVVSPPPLGKVTLSAYWDGAKQTVTLTWPPLAPGAPAAGSPAEGR